MTDNVLFHRHAKVWEQYKPVRGNGRQMKANQKYWYFRDSGQVSNPPEGELAVATHLFDNMTGELFSITWSGLLPPTLHRAQMRDNSPSEESEDELDSQSGDQARPEQLLLAFMQGIESSVYYSCLVGPIHQPTASDLAEISKHIRLGRLLVCSDGSFSQHGGTGAHAWVFLHLGARCYCREQARWIVTPLNYHPTNQN